ncbi:hypothetical protein [Streptomyces sp. NPDC059918]|uniref:hypothetical protein n=1 Tax=unclassified Streptomyces TaxID=2593676 RepID=UPI003663F50F
MPIQRLGFLGPSGIGEGDAEVVGGLGFVRDRGPQCRLGLLDPVRRWNAGKIPADGCNTHAQVLLSEAVEYPQFGPGCALTGGVWWSYRTYTAVNNVSGLDIDHMVPLAGAWDFK